MMRNGFDKHNGIYQDRTNQPQFSSKIRCLAGVH